MAIRKVRPHGPEFVVLVGNFPYGSDPSSNNPVYQAPPPTRQAVGFQAIDTNWGGNGVEANHTNARMGGTPGPQTAQFTVADNDFSTGIARLFLGNYELIAGIDYLVGAGVVATAVNLAAAIDNMVEFSAPVPGAAIVSFEYHEGGANEVDFKVLHEGSKVNFTLLVPADGVMAKGGPVISAPRLI